jgi:cytochrome c-type biogenesis protein CcmH
MLFWIFAVLLTLAASLAVLVPLAGTRKRYALPRDHEIEVYRDQLAELERDAARGLIKPADAQEARAEIGRRIIRSGSAAADEASGPPPGRFGRMVGAAAVLAIPLVSWGVYAVIGSPDLPGQPLSARVAPAPENQSIDQLIARAETHLVANPDDGRGWEVVAPIYLRMGRFDDAVAAHRNVIRLLGSNAERQASLGEALVNAAGGMVPDAATQAFQAALALDPKNAKARFYLASGMAQGGDLAGAQTALEAMLVDMPAETPWRGAVEEAIRDVRQRMAPAAAQQAPGPAPSDIEAAQSMSEADRTAMIETMVAGLDERLRQNPLDVDGWMRLVRSYMVLGKTGEARDAFDRGIKALDGASENGRKLTAFAATIGVSASGENQ